MSTRITLTSARATRRAFASAAAPAPPVAATSASATGGAGNGAGALETASFFAAVTGGRGSFFAVDGATSPLWAVACDAGGGVGDSVVLSISSSSNKSSSFRRQLRVTQVECKGGGVL